MKKILIPIDGSETSLNALEKGIDIAKTTKGKVLVINVIPSISSYNFYAEGRSTDGKLMEELMAANNFNSQKMLEDAIKPFKDLDVEIDKTTIIGNAAEEIINEAEEGEYDLIVMGSRGLGRFSRTLLGSVSEKVLHHSNVSVLIVKQ